MVEGSFKRLLQQAHCHCHRGIVLASGSTRWCHDQASRLVTACADKRTIRLPAGDAAPSAFTLLGTEIDILIWDAHAGFDPDAFAAAAGAIRGGGALILLTPPESAWPSADDPVRRRIAVAGYDAGALPGRAIRRLIRVLGNTPAIWWLREGYATPPLPAASGAPSRDHTAPPLPCLTHDQARAVAAIRAAATAPDGATLVLTADRGRGKTAGLGIAAAALTATSKMKIIVTAPRRSALAPLFAQCRTASDEPAVTFRPPDRLLRERPAADLLMVDEAAGIPAALLRRMLAYYPRTVFATTVHGYEGSGRGFALRFQRLLDAQRPGWHNLRLETPVRWAPGDPLERLLFRALLLNGEPAPAEAVADLAIASCRAEPLDRDALMADEPLLRELFGLLVSAHYRTTPLDLWHLLDGPNLTIYAIRRRGHVAAVLLAALEGGFDAATAEAIWAGVRRPRGHLLPQALAAYTGLAEAPGTRGLRVLRIAVHPELRRRGLGGRFIEMLAREAAAQGRDWIGASFGAAPDLLDFWHKSGCRPVRIGMRRDTASGTHSVLVMRPLSPAGERLFATARQRLARHLPDWFSGPLEDLEPELIARLAAGTPVEPPSLAMDTQDWLDVAAFALGRRSYEVIQTPARKLAAAALPDPQMRGLLTPDQQRLLALRLVERRPWSDCVGDLGLTGRAQAVALLRQALAVLVTQGAPTSMAGRLGRLHALTEAAHAGGKD